MLEKNPGTRQEVHEEAACSFPVCWALTMGSDKMGTADANKVKGEHSQGSRRNSTSEWVL